MMEKKSVSLMIALLVAIVVMGLLVLGGRALINRSDTPDVVLEDDSEGSVLQQTDMDEDTDTVTGDIVISTNLGDIVVDLFEEKAPLTTKNFLDLVENKFYDGVRFHRIVRGFVIQAGDPFSKDKNLKDQWGRGGPGYTINDEFVSGLSNTRGTLSMANTGQPNSGSSQFFINTVDNLGLDFDKEPLSSKHAVFGRVVSGMDVVNAIEALPTDARGVPSSDAIIESVKIVE